MKVLTDIRFEPDVASLMGEAHVSAGSAEAAEFEALLDMACSVGRPKAAYRECFIDARGDDAVTIGGVAFTSRTLRMNLDNVGRVFAYVATCGAELDRVHRPTGDVLAEFWWDAIKAAFLGAAQGYLNEHLTGTYRLGRTISMNPGSGDVTVWPIEQQRQLFALLGDVQREIGVTLTDSCLMVPNKTVSGILFPGDHNFRACQLCHREDCPSRSAAFDADLWEATRHT